jgi:hypothetical protein
MSYLSPAPTVGAVVGAAPVVVGPVGSKYPITSTAAAGGAAVTINQAITDLNASGGGIILLSGGPGKTFWTEATVHLKENVDVWSDGVDVEAMNGAQFTPVIGNLTTESLTGLIFLGLPLAANGVNSGYTAQALTVTTAVAVTFPTLVGSLNPAQGTVMYAASAAVTTCVINGLTMSTTGPWYVTPTDTVVFTFSSGQTFTFTQLIDGWWTYNTRNCRWVGCGPWNGDVSATQFQAGCAFTLDAGSVQVSASNDIDIFSVAAASPGWAAGLRFNGSAGKPTANNNVRNFAMQAVQFRGVDIAQLTDTNNFTFVRVPKVASGVLPYVGVWLGSASGALGQTATTCDRQTFQALLIDSAGNTDNPIVLGNYNGAGATVFPSLVVRALFANTGSPVTDLRTTAIHDYDIDSQTASFRYRAGASGQSATAGTKLGFSNQVAVPNSTVATAKVPYKTRLYIKTVGGATAAIVTDPNGTAIDLIASFIIGGDIELPAESTIAVTWTVIRPTWTSYLGE